MSEQAVEYQAGSENLPQEGPTARERALWFGIRQGLLALVDAIERYLGIDRTAELRRQNGR